MQTQVPFALTTDLVIFVLSLSTPFLPAHQRSHFGLNHARNVDMLLPLARHHQPISSYHSICFPLLQFDCPFPLPKSKPYRQNPTRVSMLLPIRSFTRLSLFLFKWKFDFMEMNHSTVACREKREPPTAGALDALVAELYSASSAQTHPATGHEMVTGTGWQWESESHCTVWYHVENWSRKDFARRFRAGDRCGKGCFCRPHEGRKWSAVACERGMRCKKLTPCSDAWWWYVSCGGWSL